MDQASKLRAMAQGTHYSVNYKANMSEKGGIRTIAICSGKGGVGKTNLVVNLAICLGKLGKKVVIFDADLGLANVDILLGIIPRYTIYDVIKGRKSLEEIMLSGPEGVRLIPGGSGFNELADLGRSERDRLLDDLTKLDAQADFLLVDTGAGISRNVIGFAAAAKEVIVILTPEPTAVTDAYGLIKVLGAYNIHKEVGLVINRTSSEAEGTKTYEKLEKVSARFLNVKINRLGFISDDKLVSNAVKDQKPFSVLYPHSTPTAQMQTIAANLIGDKPRGGSSGMGRFLEGLMKLWS